MKTVLLLGPLHGNGGIVSWLRKLLITFSNEEFTLVPISSVLHEKSINASFFTRAKQGLKELVVIKKSIKKALKDNSIDIFHTTTSGSLGSWRDYQVGKLCKKRGIKTILHCHYGCMRVVLNGRGLKKKLLLMSLKQYDQIWVLDRYTYEALEQLPATKGRVFLTPNSIDVTEMAEIQPKEYKNFAFIANIVPTKGVFELVEAFKALGDQDVMLNIVGPADNDTLFRLTSAISNEPRIKYHGKLPNDQAVELLKSMDVLVLPTYYSGEAFPISILEAMSYGKLVISTPRAAIPDMLTAIDGSRCGLLVPERSVKELKEAMEYAITNTSEMDEMCRKAYDKVHSAYRMDVVYEIYRSNYRKLFN